MSPRYPFFAALLFVPGLVVLVSGILAARRNKFQIGLAELMLLPVLLIPACFSIATEYNDGHSGGILRGIALAFYALSFALLPLSYNKGVVGYRASEIVGSAVVGGLVLFVWWGLTSYIFFGY